MNDKAVVEAIQDLSRITIALSDKVGSKSDAVRKLDSLAIPASRIAAIMAMKLNDVTSLISKERRRQTGKSKGRS
jgi:hypothetical protein